MPYDLPNGQLSLYPPTIQLALKVGSRRYVDFGATCDGCNSQSPVRYVEGNTCQMCMTITENARIAADTNTSFNRRDAILKGQDGYYTDQRQACGNGPHLLYKAVKDGKCHACRTDKPTRNRLREEAVLRDAEFYTASKSCPICHTRSKRVTLTDECTGCNPGIVKQAIHTQSWYGDRITAGLMGFRYYVDSSECRQGHTGARYVKSGGCLVCLGVAQS